MTTSDLTTPQKILKYALGAALIFAGVGHLTFARAEFQAQVPDWVPMSKDLVVLLSGVVEIALGAAIAFVHKKTEVVGLVAAAFFVAVFPGNWHQYADHIDAFGLNTDTARFVRLFFQPVLIVWALYATGAWNWLMGKKNRPRMMRRK